MSVYTFMLVLKIELVSKWLFICCPFEYITHKFGTLEQNSLLTHSTVRQIPGLEVAEFPIQVLIRLKSLCSYSDSKALSWVGSEFTSLAVTE